VHAAGDFANRKRLSGRLPKQLEQGCLGTGKAGSLHKLSRVNIERTDNSPKGEQCVVEYLGILGQCMDVKMDEPSISWTI